MTVRLRQACHRLLYSDRVPGHHATLTSTALLFFLAFGCSDPAVQEFGRAAPPLPGPTSPDPILYHVSAKEVKATPGVDLVVFDIVLAVTHEGNQVEGASVYLWISTGILQGTEVQSGMGGLVTIAWQVPSGNRAILSACAVPRLQDPCLPTVVVRRDT